MLIRSTGKDKRGRGCRRFPKHRAVAIAISDDLPADLRVTIAELEAIERFVLDVAKILDAATNSSARPAPDAKGSTARAPPSQKRHERP